MKKNKGNILYLIIALEAAGMLLFAMIFNESYILSGLLTSFSLFVFLVSGRLVRETKEFILFAVILWIGVICRYFYLLGGAPQFHILVASVALAYSLILTLIIAADNFACRRFRPGFAVLVFPLLYSGMLFGLSACNFGTILDFVAFLKRAPLIVQTNSLTGESGMIFLITLVFSLIAYAIVKRGKKAAVLSAAFVIVAAMTAFGFIRTKNVKGPDLTLHVATATTRDVNFLSEDDDTTVSDCLTFLRAALAEAKEGKADLFITNEEYLLVPLGKEEWFEKEVSQIIKEYQIPALICYEYEGNEDKLGANITVFYDNNGKVVDEYFKHSLIPGLETGYFEPGDDRPKTIKYKFADKDVTVSYVICFDINNTYLMNMLDDDTELLIVPSWDWDTANLEQRNTYFRSVEHNTTLLKNTMNGFTYVSGPWGLIVDMIDCRGEAKEVHFVDVPIWLK